MLTSVVSIVIVVLCLVLSPCCAGFRVKYRFINYFSDFKISRYTEEK